MARNEAANPTKFAVQCTLALPKRIEQPVSIAVPRVTEPQPHLEDGGIYRKPWWT